MDPTGAAYVVGWTTSADFDRVRELEGPSGSFDAFATRLTQAGSALHTSTYIGGSGPDQARAIALDSAGAAYIAGSTSSTDFDRVGGIEGPSGSTDAFAIKLEASPGPASPLLTDSDPESPLPTTTTPRSRAAPPRVRLCACTAAPRCGGSVAAVGSAAQLASPGLTVTVAGDSTNTFWATAADEEANSPCSSTSVTYVEDSIAPATLTVSSTTPASPANDNSPEVKGSGAEAASTVSIYDNADLHGVPLGSGTAAAFNTGAGITATVPADSTTNLRATATDAAGNTSPCSNSIVYVEDSTAPVAPTVGATDPVSPANDNNPEVRGSAEAASTVSIYRRRLHRDPAGSGTAAAFNGAGITATVPADSTTNLRATATDAAGNVSACSTALAYVEDSTAPAAPTVTDTDPDSPANDNNPEVKGSAEAGSTVRIYSTAGCTGTPLATGTAATFSGAPGSPPRSPTTRPPTSAPPPPTPPATSPACSTALAYIEDSTAPATPPITDTDPDSPANDNNPEVKGSRRGRLDGAGSTDHATCTGSPLAAGTRRELRTAPGSRRRSPTTRPPTCAPPPPTPPATSPPARRRSPTSRTRPPPPTPTDHRHRPRLARPTTTTPRSGARRRGRLDGDIYDDATCTRRPAGLGHAPPPSTAAPGSPPRSRPTRPPTSAPRSTTTPATPRRVPTRSPTSRTRAPPPRRASTRHRPRLARRRQQPRGDRLGRSGLDRAPLQGLRAAPIRRRTPPRRQALPRPASRSRSPTTRPPTCARPPPTPPATSLPARRHSPTSRTRPPRSLRPSAPPAPPRPPTTTTPRSAARPRPPRRCASTTTPPAPGPSLASGSAAAFNGAGITVSVPDDSTTNLRATATDQAGHVSPCSNSISYLEDSTIPAAPTVDSTTPASPANDNNPEVRGSGAETAATVNIYDNATCTGAPLGSGTAAAFNTGAGITATVAADSTTNLRAAVKDDAGNTSPCSNAIAYVEDSSAPASPQVDSTDPASPADDNNPEVIGSAEAGSTVRLYKGSSCTDPPAHTASAASFASPGFTISVPDDSTTNLRATATDAAGNVSGLLDGTRLRRGLDRPGRSDRQRHQPRLARQRQQPRAQRLGRGRLDGAHLRQRHLHRAPACQRPRRRLQRRRDHRLGARRLDHQPARHGHRPGGPRLAVFQLDLLSRGLDDPRRSDRRLDDPRLARKRQQPRGQRLRRRGRLDGEASTTTPPAPAPRWAPAPLLPSTPAPGSPPRSPADSTTNLRATATDAAGNASACSTRSPTSRTPAPRLRRPGRLHEPRLARRRQQPRGDRLGRSGLDRAPLQGLQLHRSAGAHRLGGELCLARLHDLGRPTTRPPTCAPPPPTPPATSPAARRRSTYVEDSTAPVAPTVSATSPASPANDNNPEVSGSAEAASTVRIYDNATCTGPLACQRPRRRLQRRRDHRLGARRLDHQPARHGHRRRRATSRLLQRDLLSSRTRRAPPLRPSTRTDPGLARKRQQPRGQGLRRRGRLDGEHLRQRHLHRRPAGLPAPPPPSTPAPGSRSTVAADSTTNLRATATDAAGNTSACSTALTYVEDSTAPPLRPSTRTDPASPANDNNPEVKRHGRGGLDGARSTRTQPAPSRRRTRPRPQLRLARAHRSRSPTTRPPTSAPPPPTPPATSPPARRRSPTSRTRPPRRSDRSPPPAPPRPPTTTTPRSAARPRPPRRCASTPTPPAPGPRSAPAPPPPSHGAGITVTVPDDTTTNLRATATDAAGNVSPARRRSPTSRTRPPRPLRPSTRRPPPRPPTTTTPRSRARRRGRLDGEHLRQRRPARRPAGYRHRGAFNTGAGITATVAADSTTNLRATATDAAGNASACSTALAYVEDSTAPAAPTGRLDDAPPRRPTTTTPRSRARRRGRLDGDALHNASLHRHPAGDTGTAAAFNGAGITVTVARRLDHQPARHRHRRRRQRLGLLDAHRLRRGLDRPGHSDRHRHRPRLARKRQQPRGQRLGRGRLDGAHLRQRHLLGPLACKRPRRRLQRAPGSPSRSPPTRPPTCAPPPPTPPATSPAARRALTYVEDSTAPAAPTVDSTDPGLARKRQQPRGQGLRRRSRLDGEALRPPPPAPAPRWARGTGCRLQHRRRDHGDGRRPTRPPTCAPPPPTPPATSPAARRHSPTSKTPAPPPLRPSARRPRPRPPTTTTPRSKAPAPRPHRR